MFPYLSRTVKRLSSLLILVMFANMFVLPAPIARAATSIQIAPQLNQASPLPQDRFGYQEFYTDSKIFSYTNGEVCVSSSPTSCESIQMDDGFKISVSSNGVNHFLGDFLSRTQPVPAVNVPTQYLSTSSINTIFVTLYDVQGPSRGGNPLYLVFNPAQSSSWAPNCIPKDFGAADRMGTDFEIFVTRLWTMDKYDAFNYSVQGQLCTIYDVIKTPGSTGGFTYKVQGTLNGQNYDLLINNKGEIIGGNVTHSSSFARIYMGMTDCRGCIMEIGPEYQRKAGNRAQFGIDIMDTSRALARFKKANDALNLNINPNFEPNKGLIYSIFAAFGVIIFGSAVLFSSVPPSEASPIIKTAFALPDQQPTISAAAASSAKPATYFVLSIAEQQTVPDAVRQAVSTRTGAMINYATLNNITSRSRVSGYTKFDYEAEGFTPNGAVMVTFGTPDGNRDLFRQIIQADNTGKIKATIEMPAPPNFDYGQYLLLAMDYESAENSVYSFFANPNSPNLHTVMAATLIDVVPDVTPPVTTAFAMGPLDTNKMFRDSITIRLDAVDDLSGVARSEYSLNNGQSWTTLVPGATFTINGNGITQFLYRSVDKYGNVEATKNSGPIIINKYVVFANYNSTNSLQIYGNTGVVITGNMHTNGATMATYNTNFTLNGMLTRVGSISGSGNSSTTIPSQQSAAVPMLTYPMSFYEQRATRVINGDWRITSTATSIHGLYYVKGNVTIDATTVDGNLTIVATGNIIDRSTGSSFINTDPNNGILFYAGGNIELRTTHSNALGMFYAPNGTVFINGVTGGTIRGSFVGKYVNIKYATDFNMLYDAGFASGTYQLPLAPRVG